MYRDDFDLELENLLDGDPELRKLFSEIDSSIAGETTAELEEPQMPEYEEKEHAPAPVESAPEAFSAAAGEAAGETHAAKHRRPPADEKKSEDVRGRILPGRCNPFFCTLAAVTVLAWLLPLRPSVSVNEKRDLEKFPEFSAQSLFNGDFFDGINLWFSDTFTGRETWINASQKLQTLYGHSDIVIYGNLDAGDAVPVEVPAVPMPAAEPETVPVSAGGDASAPETAADAESAPEEVQEETLEYGLSMEQIQDEIVEIGSIIQIGDSAYAFTTFNQSYADQYIATMNKAAAEIPEGVRLFTVNTPRSTTILLPKEYRKSIGCACEEDMISYVNSGISENVIKVDVISNLLRHSDEYIYFHGDHHWTALGAYYAYEAWCGAAGFDPVPLSEYEEDFQGPFRGTYYYKANQSDRIAEDTVYTYAPPGDVHLWLCADGNDSPTFMGYEIELLPQIAPTSSDKYVTFLLGDHPMCTFVNNDITDGSSCLIFKDSHGNPFSYYFSQHYQYVYVLDYRYYAHRSLTGFIDTYGIDDVIINLSIDATQGGSANELIARFMR